MQSLASLPILKYALAYDGDDAVWATLDRCKQRTGPDKWAVRTNFSCLTKAGDMEYERSPSGRTEEFIALFRFDTEEEALAAWRVFFDTHQEHYAHLRLRLA